LVAIDVLIKTLVTDTQHNEKDIDKQTEPYESKGIFYFAEKDFDRYQNQRKDMGYHDNVLSP